MRTSKPTSLLAILVAASFPSFVVAANLVVNPGFEMEPPEFNYLDGWTGSVILADVPHSGLYSVGFVDSQIFDSLAQALPTTPGSSYLVDFWLANPPFGEPPNNNFIVSFGNSGLSLANAPNFGYTEYSFTAQALSGQTTLLFQGRNQPGAFYLDDVSVTLIPEPGSLALAAVGFFALMACQLEKRRPANLTSGANLIIAARLNSRTANS